MLFNSASFMFYFLPAALLGWIVCGKFGRRAVIGWFAFVSVVFYGVWKPKYVVVLLGSMLINYGISRMIARYNERAPRTANLWMIAGVAANLAVLAYFKYLFRFLIFMNQMQFTHTQWRHILLPLGISFFTFTQIAYLVDLRQGEAEPQDFVSYALFVTFFPHLIAGPILHHREMMPQFAEEKRRYFDWNDFAVGLSWFILGLAKKVLIADRLGQFADATFAAPRHLALTASWFGVLNYSMQLYFDFSGYCDMAMGLARMFGIRFPLNFNSPYKATNIIDFWARWHMTLTRYLTLYLYNPIALTVNRRRLAAGKAVSKKASRTIAGFSVMVALPLVITMFLAGVWHGAGLQFIIFGLLHAAYLCINHAWRIFRKQPANAPRKPWSAPLGWTLTYLGVLVAQVFFRANSTRDALGLLGGMAGAHGLGLHAHRVPLKEMAVLLAFPFCWLLPNTQELMGYVETHSRLARALTWRPNFAWGAALACMLLGSLAYISYSTTFLYFQF